MRARAILTAAFLLAIAGPTASARTDNDACQGVTIVVNGVSCPGSCSGITIILLSSGNCQGTDGAEGQDGGTACSGTNVIVGGDDNCQGGDGGAGTPTTTPGDGGAGCQGYNVAVGANCQGGDGGDG